MWKEVGLWSLACLSSNRSPTYLLYGFRQILFYPVQFLVLGVKPRSAARVTPERVGGTIWYTGGLYRGSYYAGQVIQV